MKNKLYLDGGINVDRIITLTISTEEIVCSICHKIFFKPISCSNCENHFCSSCINAWKKKKNKCPFNCILEIRKASKVINSLLSKITIKCLYSYNGCDLKNLYETILKHEEYCTFRFVNNKKESKEKLDVLKGHVSVSFREKKSDLKVDKVENEAFNKPFNSVNYFSVDNNIDAYINSDNEQYPKLLESLNKTYTNNIVLKNNSNNETFLFAKKNFEKNEEIFFIPKEFIITNDNVKNLEFINKIKSNDLSLPQPVINITIYLLLEKLKKDSIYESFITNIPNKLSSIGIFMQENEIYWLKGSTLLYEIRNKYADLNRLYNLISQELEITWEDLILIYSFVNANIHPYINTNNDEDYCLLPLKAFLLCDTNNTDQCVLKYNSVKDSFVIISEKSIKEGKRISLRAMHEYSNQYLLTNYGIVINNNDNDTLEINLFYNDYDRFIIDKKFIIKSDDEPFIFNLKGNFESKNISKFFAILRIIEAGFKDELKHDFNYYLNCPINFNNEKKVIKKIELIFKSKLKNYSISDEQEEKLLKSDLLTNNQKNCLKIVSSEKKIAKKFIQFSENIQKLFDKKTTIKELNKIQELKFYVNSLQLLNL